MKILHTADLHLDSTMTSNLDAAKAKIRRMELLKSFEAMVSYAENNDIHHILIAGDLFDKKVITALCKNIVWQSILSHSDITFYYLRGNHDDTSFFDDCDEIPINLKLFNDRKWSYYNVANVNIAGIELGDSTPSTYINELTLNEKDINIVMLHGQDVSGLKADGEVIPISNFKNRFIDYMALGHIHSYRLEELDNRGVYCYPGCLEGRGFDECGECGFVVIDINEDKHIVTSEFVAFSKRCLHRVEVDVTGLADSYSIAERMRNIIDSKDIPEKDLVKCELVGKMDVDGEKDINFLVNELQDDYFLFKIKDRVERVVRIQDYANDESLKGEFIRVIGADESLTEEEKAEIIHLGLRALANEEVLN